MGSLTKIRASARDEDCTIRLEQVCNFDPTTTVLAHANTHRAGKGGAHKAADELGAYACYCCHMVVDGQHACPSHLTEEHVELAFWHGHAETYLKLKAKGLVTSK